MSQRNIQLLGRNVNLNSLLSISINEYLRKNTLDPFTQMWAEVNDDVNLGQKRGRVVSHIFSELISDIRPSFVFCQTTQRWVRSLPELVTQPDRARYPSSAQSWFWYGRKVSDPPRMHTCPPSRRAST
jgi:hypothetical protein